MPHVRSVSVGVWLARGSRHESAELSGIAHFVEHMLFKGTATRSAEDIAQTIDSIGGQMDAFTSKEYAGYYLKVLDEHLPLAVDVLADIVTRPALSPDDIEREKKVILEEIKMVEDTPDDLVHEIFTETLWQGHPLGRPILGTPETVSAFTRETLRRILHRHLRRAQSHHRRGGQHRARAGAGPGVARVRGHPRRRHPRRRNAARGGAAGHHPQQGVGAEPRLPGHRRVRQDHANRYASYVLNTVLGGSMSLAPVPERAREARAWPTPSSAA